VRIRVYIKYFPTLRTEVVLWLRWDLCSTRTRDVSPDDDRNVPRERPESNTRDQIETVR